MSFLHSSDIRLHGKLKSNNVVIDGRWACKLTDYGLTVFTSGEGPDPELSDHNKYGSKTHFIIVNLFKFWVILNLVCVLWRMDLL